MFESELQAKIDMEESINSTIIDNRKDKKVSRKDEPELVEDEKRVKRNMTRINS